MTTASNGTGTERIWARVAPDLKARIKKRAEDCGQNEVDWVRDTLIAGVKEVGKNETAPSNDHLTHLIEARIDRLERRILDENSVMLRLGFEILFDLARVRALSMSASIALNNSTPEEEQGLLDHLEQEGVTYFLGRKNALFAELNQMRKEAKAKAEASANRPVTVAS